MADVLGFKMNAAGFFTWFTSMFLHGDPIFHLGGNMYFLWLFGSVVEDALGRLRYLALYVAGGLAASLTHGLVVLLFTPQYRDVPAIGASGALAAVVGIFAVRFYKNHMRLAYFVWIVVFVRWGVFQLTSLAGVTLWALRELASGLIVIAGAPSGVANWAHIGGLAFGVIAALTFGFIKEADTEYLGDEAALYAMSGTNEIAAAKYAQLAAQAPDDPDVLLQKAASTAATGATEQAAADFGKAIALLSRVGRKADIVDAYERCGWVGLDARTLQTVASMSEAVQRHDLAARGYTELLQQHPGTREAERAHFRLAHVYLAMGMPAEARQTWDSFAATYPQSEWHAYADRAFTQAG